MDRVQLDLGEYKPELIAPGVGAWRYERKLPLVTDGHLRLIFLGTGAAFSVKMFQSNLIVIKGGTALFVDLGTKSTLKMAELGLSVHDIQHLLITHSHADHVGSIEELALKRRYEAPFMDNQRGDDEPFGEFLARIIAARNSGKYRPRLYLPHHYSQILWGWSLRGGLAFSEEVDLGGPKGEMLLGHFFHLVPPTKLDGFGVDSWEIKVGDIRVQTFVTKHIPDSAERVTESMYSVGMVIDGRVYLSGDTRFEEQTIIRFGEGCEVLFHDCQDFPGGVHAFYGDLMSLPERLRQKMYLYHLSDGMLKKNVRADGFAGLTEPVPVAYDFK